MYTHLLILQYIAAAALGLECCWQTVGTTVSKFGQSHANQYANHQHLSSFQTYLSSISPSCNIVDVDAMVDIVLNICDGTRFNALVIWWRRIGFRYGTWMCSKILLRKYTGGARH